MTTKEAIRALYFYKTKLYNGIYNDKIEAFDIAIKALKKQQEEENVSLFKKEYKQITIQDIVNKE